MNKFTGNIDDTVAAAFKLYMPQDKYEITELYQFVVDHYNNRPRDEYNVLEIGTKFGGTFYLWASMNQSPGLNISIDMNDGGQHGGIAESEMDKRDLWFAERFDNVKFIRGDSHDFYTYVNLQSVLRPRASGYVHGMPYKDIDFLFIDGDHTYEGVKKDFEMYLPFVKRGGIVAFHDINDTERHRERNVHVAKLWKELVDSEKYETVEFNSNLDWAGIGALIIK